MSKQKTNKKPLLLIGLAGLALGLTTITVSQSKWWFYTKTGQSPPSTQSNGTYDPQNRSGFYEGRKIAVPPKEISRGFATNVLGDSNSRKRVEVNLSEQRLTAYENDTKVYSFAISSGNPWTPTPTGTFYPWIKLRYTRMEGGNPAFGTYYNLPNVPYVVYFYNSEIPKWKGYGLHGTYWHSNFGNPMSHGCVNAPTEDMGRVYEWLDLDTPIHIYGNTPGA